ncbi:MAG: ATP-dependent sacrificial sulfur transferase LarE [Spirochaetota bacterium]
MSELDEALGRLKEWFASVKRCAVAFSGGVDSTFLLAAIREYTDTEVVALTALTDYIPRWELAEAKEMTAFLGVEHLIMSLPVPEEIQNNPERRCYLCKHSLFSAMAERATQEGIDLLADGTNSDDAHDYRPGMQALRELDVKSPLKACGFTKNLIRQGCSELGLETTANKPAYACLLTRLPHGRTFDASLLRRIEAAELVLHRLGFPAVRVRVYENIARIELPKEHIDQFMGSHITDEVAGKLKELGFSRVTLDLDGYRQGSMNEGDTSNGAS